jgi:hypothetical protein
MYQQPIRLFLAVKRLSVPAIYNELVAMLGPDVIGYSTVTNYLRQWHFPSTFCATPDDQQQPLLATQFWMPSKSSHFLLSLSPAHLHSAIHGPSTLNPMTWFYSKTSLMGSPQPHGGSKKLGGSLSQMSCYASSVQSNTTGGNSLLGIVNCDDEICPQWCGRVREGLWQPLIATVVTVRV